MRQVIADASRYGDGSTNKMESIPYTTVREIADDLDQMLSDPSIFLFDPAKGDRLKSKLSRSPRRLYGREK